MSASSWQAVWLLVVEVAAVVGLTWLIAWRLRSVVWQRTLWQAGLIALVGVLVVEFAALTPVFTRKEVQADAPVVKIEAEAMEVRTQVNAPVEIAATELSIPVPAEPLVSLEPVAAMAPVKQEVVLTADRMTVSTEAKAEATAVKSSEDKFPLGLALLLLVWTVGSGVLAGRLLVGRFLLLRFCARSQSVYDVRLYERVQGIAGKLGLKQTVQVLETGRIQTPVVFGLFRVTIALPVGFTERFERRQQEAILAHELAHLAARDPLWYLLADALVSVLWWHPLVWVARARLQVTSEMAADEACVLAEQGPETLAECLVTIAQEMHGQGALESIGIEGSGFRSRLGQRVERLLNLSAEAVSRPAVWRTRLVKAALPVLLVMVLLMASGWVRRDQSAPWSGLVGNAWSMMTGILKTEEMDIRRDPRPRLVWVPKVLEVNEVLKVSSRISGRVMLDGVAPKEREIQVGNPELAKLARKPFLTRFYVVSEDKGLGDTVVYIKKGLEGKKFAVPEDTMVFTQRGLEWHPYIGALRAGQKVRFTMETPIMQSVHFSPKNPNNKEWNRALIPLETTIDHPELMARVMSDTMPWLYAYISVFEHPYFAVTDKEGKFEFPESLPAGRYTLGVLHRRAGEMELEIEVEAQSGSGLVITLGEKKSRKVETRLAMNGDVGKLVGKRELNEDTEKKLDELVLPELSFDGLPLAAALQQLMDESKRLDPQKKGLEFNHGGVLSGKTKISIDHSGDAWAEPGGNIKQRVEDVVVTVKPARKGLSFRQALEAICNGASVPSRFTIRNGGVFVSVMLNEEGTKLAMNGEGKTLLTPNPDVRTNVVQATSRRSLILSKLEQIVLKEVFFDGVPLAEVVRILQEESVKLDPEKKGINFIINSNLDDQPSSRKGSPSESLVVPQPRKAVDLDKMIIKINPSLKSLRMIEALDAITKVATPIDGVGLSFMVEDYAVVFRKRVIDPPQLFTRIFKVDKDKLIQGLEKQAGVKMMPLATNLTAVGTSNFPPNSAATNQGVQVTGYSVARSREFAHLAQQFFASCGVNMSTNGSGQTAAQIFFNDRTGVLMARASLRDLELIAHGLEAIGAVVDNTPIPSGISSAGSSVVRFYKFEAAAYVRGLEKVTGKKVAEMSAAPLAAQLNGGRGTTNKHHVEWHQIELLTREFLMAQGADLSAGNFGLTYPQNPEDVQEVRWNIGGSAKAEEVFQRSGQKILAAGKQDGEVAPLGRATNQVAIKPAAESVTRFIKFEIVPFVRGLEKLTEKKVNELAEAELAGLADPVERQNVTNMHHARWKQIFMLSQEFLTSQGADMTSGSIRPIYPKEPEALEARWLVNTSVANLEVIQKGIDKIMAAGQTGESKPANATRPSTNDVPAVLKQSFKLRHENPTNIVRVIRSTFASPQSTAIADIPNNALLVNAPEQDMKRVEELVRKLDVAVEADERITKVFKVDADSSMNGFREMMKTSGFASTNLQEMMREFIRKSGVNLNEGNTNGSVVFLNDRTGVLLARARPAEMQIIENAIEVLNIIPPQVQIEAQYIEVPEKVAEEMGLKWFANGLPPDVSKPVAAMQLASAGSNSNRFGIHVVAPQVPNHVSILSPEQARELLKRLDDADGVDRLSAPRVTTVNKRQAQISVMEAMTVVVGRTNRVVKGEAGKKDSEEPVFITEQLAMGPVLDVIPNVYPDGKSMRLDWVFSLTEFLGYEKPEKSGELPKPLARRRQVTNQNVIQDGYTLVAGCGMADMKTEAKKGLFSSGRAKTEKKMVLILMKVNLLDPAGNYVNRK